MYRLSYAQVQFMAVDNTHTKYLKGSDKKAWKNYGEAYKAQNAFMDFMSGLDAGAGEEDASGRMDIPIKKND